MKQRTQRERSRWAGGNPPPDTSELERLYLRYRAEFIAFARRDYGVQEADAEDIFQESFLSVYRDVASGRLTGLTCSMRTYLFQAGKFRIFNRRRDRPADSQTELTPDLTYELTHEEEWAEKQEQVYRAVLTMGEPCDRVLTLFYWERKSMEEIAGEMNYSNAQVAKNRKNLCMKKLRATLEQMFGIGSGTKQNAHENR